MAKVGARPTRQIRRSQKVVENLTATQPKLMQKLQHAGYGDLRIQKFVDTFYETFNANAAARAAGFTPKVARVKGFALLRRADVQEMLARKAMQTMAANQTSATEIVGLLLELARLDPLELYGYNGKKVRVRLRDLHEIPLNVRRCISEMKVVRQNLTAGDGKTDEVVQIKFWSKPAALDVLAQHVGLLKLVVQHDHVIHAEQLEQMTDDQLVQEAERLTETLRKDALARKLSRVPVADVITDDSKF